MKIIAFITISLLAFTTIAQDTPPPVATNNESTNEDGVMYFPDVEAKFVGGSLLLQKYIFENVAYPQKAITKNKEGKVVVQFVVEADGSITNVKVINKAYKLLNKEAIRVIEKMPNWSPGEVKGTKCRTRCMLPINFTLN